MKHLQSRLILGFLVVILVTLCGLSGVLLLLFSRYAPAERVAMVELNIQARGIITLLRRLPRFNPARSDFAQLKELAKRQEVRLAWATPERIILFDSENQWDGPAPYALFSELEKETDGHWSGRIREGGRRWLVVAYPLPEVDGKPTGYLIAAKSIPILAFVQQFQNTMIKPILQAGLVALFIGIAIALLISRSIARPLNEVADAARALATGDMSARAPAKGPEEVRAMARTFNEMATTIQKSQQAQHDLVANVAHDLRTPLTSIQGFAQAMVDGTADNPEMQAYAANAVYEEAQRMRRMTDVLLNLARFDAGEVKMHMAPLDLSALSRKRAERFQMRAEEAGITLAVEAPDPITISGDEGWLEQLLDNLLSNALAHTTEGGRITVHVSTGTAQSAKHKNAQTGWAELAVTDTGHGIPTEDLPRVFERFYRGDKSRQGGSAGLGLAIVREIALAHGGDVRAESVQDIGSRFTVKFPLPPQAT